MRALLLTLLLLAGCAPAAVAPTAPPSATTRPPLSPAPTITAPMRATLPPAWTQPPQPTISASPTSGPPTATIDARGTALFAQPTAAACATFQIDTVRSAQSYVPGESLFIAWSGVAGAELYKVTVSTQEGVVLYETATIDLNITLPGTIIGREPFYLYSIRPLNAGAEQMCNSIGQLLRLRLN